MTTFAIANLVDVRMGADIVGYLERIDATLAPFGGRFVVHGGPYERLEGDWQGDVVVLAFPGRAEAKAWYGSPAYQAILPLRTGSSRADVILVDGVGAGHVATDVLAVAAQSGS